MSRCKEAPAAMVPELVTCKTSTQRAGTATVWHSHRLIQIGYVARGQMILQTPEGTWTVGHDAFYMVAAGHLHRIENPVDEEQHSAFLRPRAATGSAADFGPVCSKSLVVRDASQIGDWLAEIIHWWERGAPEHRLAANGLMLRLAASLTDFGAEAIGAPPGHAGQGVHARWLAAVHAIEQLHCQPDLTVARVAKHLHMSRSLLFKIFRRELLRRYRVDRAKELILMGQMPMKQIAAAVGFPDVYAFSRTFKQIAGVPPSRLA